MRILVTGAAGGAWDLCRRGAGGEAGRTSSRGRGCRASIAGVELRRVDLEADGSGVEARCRRAGRGPPFGGAERGRGCPARPRAGASNQRRGDAPARRLVRPSRPSPRLHLDRPRLRRLEALEPRGRPGRAGARLRPDEARGRAVRRWRRRAGLWPASACSTGRAATGARRTSTGPWRPWAAASRSRSSRTSTGRRSTSAPPRAILIALAGSDAPGSSTSPAASG